MQSYPFGTRPLWSVDPNPDRLPCKSERCEIEGCVPEFAVIIEEEFSAAINRNPELDRVAKEAVKSIVKQYGSTLSVIAH